VFAAGYFAAVELAAALVYRAVDGDWPRFGSGVWYVMLAAIVVSMWVQAGEELGWRGYALPRLAAQWGLGRAGVLLGVVWAFWHLPLFFIPGTSTSGQSFPVYLLQVTALSVAMTFLYWRTRGSLLLVMLMHASVNNTAGIVQSSVVDATQVFGLSSSLMAWSTAAVMWIAALYFLIRMRGMPLLGSDEAMRTTHRRTAQSMAAEPNQRS
jgi:hypothetical protein